jgi:hypothetical protein
MPDQHRGGLDARVAGAPVHNCRAFDRLRARGCATLCTAHADRGRGMIRDDILFYAGSALKTKKKPLA